mmetsp:Transcript_31529/g.46183  ORF Transcript_31529/g.46183 Transcript_31529/m.46183 type:complete len:91 (-) Transcript_31529:156-428(-)
MHLLENFLSLSLAFSALALQECKGMTVFIMSQNNMHLLFYSHDGINLLTKFLSYLTAKPHHKHLYSKSIHFAQPTLFFMEFFSNMRNISS